MLGLSVESDRSSEDRLWLVPYASKERQEEQLLRVIFSVIFWDLEQRRMT